MLSLLRFATFSQRWTRLAIPLRLIAEFLNSFIIRGLGLGDVFLTELAARNIAIVERKGTRGQRYGTVGPRRHSTSSGNGNTDRCYSENCVPTRWYIGQVRVDYRWCYIFSSVISKIRFSLCLEGLALTADFTMKTKLDGEKFRFIRVCFWSLSKINYQPKPSLKWFN